MKMFKLPCFFSILLLSFCACKNPDENPPVVEYVYANGLSSSYLHGIAGQVNTLVVKSADDQGLKQLKLKITTGTGIHHHEEEEVVEHVFSPYNWGIWDTLQIVNLGGKESIDEFSWTIPDTISGGWRVEVAVLDTYGNLTSQDYTFHIQNDDQPFISVGDIFPVPGTDGVIRLTVGETLSLNGNAIDPDGLALVSCEVRKSSSQIWYTEWTTINSWTFELNQAAIPAFTEAGDYNIYLYAKDILGWRCKYVANIEVN